MHSPSSPLSLLRIVPGLLLLLAAGCTSPEATPTASAPTAPAAPAPTAAKAEGAFDDDAHALTPIESAVIAAGKDQARLTAVENDLLASMQKAGAAPALVQEAAQHLGLVLQSGPKGPNPATLAALAPMLTDPAQVDYARLALDRVPGRAVDALYLTALPHASGRARLALIESAASRGLVDAVSLIAPWLNDADPALATAAAQALGRIGGPAALAALGSAKGPLAPAVLNARLAAAARTDAATITRVAGDIYHHSAAPLPQRSAALRQLIEANSAGSVSEINSALLGTEPAFHAVAIHAVSTLAVPGAPAELANRLDSYAPAVQIPLIAALGARGDAGADPGLLKALGGTDAAVRLAAIEALGRLQGTADTARRLALLATGTEPEAKAAFASLSRLDGPGLDAFIQAGAGSGDALLQPVFIQQLAARNQTEAIPFLLSLRGSPVEALRLEALDALRAIARPSDEQALITWALGTPSKAEQNRAVRALITTILRDGAIATRADVAIKAIQSGDAAARMVLLPMLSRVAGPAALTAAGELAMGTDGAVATAATAELARWPDASVLAKLVELTAATPNATIRAAAAQGSARFLAVRGNATAAQRSQSARQLLALPLDLAGRVALLGVLNLCADQECLATAQTFLANPETASAAQDAIDAITSNLAGPPLFTASEAEDKTAFLTDGKRYTAWSVPNVPGGWLRADLHHSRPLRKITLDQGRLEWDWPEKLEVCVSDDPAQPGEPRAQVEGEREQTIVTLPAATRGRYVWLRQQGTRPSNPWAIAELMFE